MTAVEIIVVGLVWWFVGAATAMLGVVVWYADNAQRAVGIDVRRLLLSSAIAGIGGYLVAILCMCYLLRRLLRQTRQSISR